MKVICKTGGRRKLDQKVFTQTVQKWKDTVYRLAYSYMRSQADADNITQNVFLKLYRSGNAFASEEHIRNWLIKVTVNECRSLLRSWWRKGESIEQYAEKLSLEPQQKELLEEGLLPFLTCLLQIRA